MRALACCQTVALAAAVCGGCRSDPGVGRKPPGAPLAAPATARVAAAARPIGWTGVIASAEAVDLAPSFDGVLAEVRVGPGDLVAAGQVVALLDERPLREELDSALAALRETRARGPRIAVDIRSARRRVQVEQQAVEAGTSARRLLEEARFAFAAARAARGELAASIAQAQTRVDRARSRLGSTALRAPFAGSVGTRYRAPGAAVGPTAPVVRLIGGGELRLRFAAPPDAARTLRVGCKLLAEVAAVRAADRRRHRSDRTRARSTVAEHLHRGVAGARGDDGTAARPGRARAADVGPRSLSGRSPSSLRRRCVSDRSSGGNPGPDWRHLGARRATSSA